MFKFSQIGTGQNPRNFEMISQMDIPKRYSTITDMPLIQYSSYEYYMTNMMSFFNPLIGSYGTQC